MDGNIMSFFAKHGEMLMKIKGKYDECVTLAETATGPNPEVDVLVAKVKIAMDMMQQGGKRAQYEAVMELCGAGIHFLFVTKEKYTRK